MMKYMSITPPCRSGSASDGNGLTSMRSELPLSTLAGARVTSEDEQPTPQVCHKLSTLVWH